MPNPDAYDESVPATVEVKTESGRVIDINNIPGSVKVRMIMDGELSVDKFMTPDNMPGAKLAAYRKAHSVRMQGAINKIADAGDNPYKVGDIVLYKKAETEILEVGEKGLKIQNAKGKTVWIHHSKVNVSEGNYPDDEE